MKIVADENIPFVTEAFGTLGEITTLSGRAIGPEQVREADLLLVRSVTVVDERLLAGSSVRFVGSATIGLDHVDQAFLRARGIALAHAPGSNANAVAEYVVAALVALEREAPVVLGRERYAGRTLGIIGLGRIGTLVREKALALGMDVLANDPPLARDGLERAGEGGLVALEDLLTRSDIVTCHVPLTRDGPDATYHLLDDARLSLLPSHAVVINTARGAVVDNAALLRGLQAKRLGGAVLDVWEGEPAPDPALIRAVTIGTPHIAGYSWDGKVAGARMLYDAACVFLHRQPSWTSCRPEEAPPPPQDEADRKPGALVVGDADRACDERLREVVLCAYDIRRDDAALRAIGELPGPERGRAFDRLRAAYPQRLEFRHTSVAASDCGAETRARLYRLGFRVR